MSEVVQKGKLAKEASYLLNSVSTKEKNEALLLIANQLNNDHKDILAANKLDLQAGRAAGLSDAVLDRIMLDEKRLESIVEAVTLLMELTDPIGETIETSTKSNGLTITKIRVPIGVIGMIYEARPNVTVDAATLSLKTGNSIILRGSSSAIHSNKALVKSIHRALKKSALPKDAVQLIEDTSRETAKDFFRLNEYLDVLIPRGSDKLIELVIKDATVPVIETGAGNCHLFIDESAQVDMANNITINAKLQRPSVCNAIETLLIHKKWFIQHGVKLLNNLVKKGVIIYGDETVCASFSEAKIADETSWLTEFLSAELSVKVVPTLDAAINHINTYGTQHSEAIVTENAEHADKFLQNVDASSVYHNASTRFTDGFEFGYGAEIGISTQKLHARGPMGLEAMTSSKFIIEGNGQVR